MNFNLFSTYYDERHPPRLAEYRSCLLLNQIEFDHVCILSQAAPPPDWFTGEWVIQEQRQLYADVLALIKSTPDDINIIANGDIAFLCDGLAQIGDTLTHNQVFCLSRWDIMDDGSSKLFDIASSQDSWCFRGQPKADIGGDYYFGCNPGCDNKFAYELMTAGYDILNPAKSIKSYHFHRSGYGPNNNGSDRIPAPYLLVEPHYLGDQPQYHHKTKTGNRPSCFQDTSK